MGEPIRGHRTSLSTGNWAHTTQNGLLYQMMTLEHSLVRTWLLPLAFASFQHCWYSDNLSQDIHVHHYGATKRWQKENLKILIVNKLV